jgi:hypothetical protein
MLKDAADIESKIAQKKEFLQLLWDDVFTEHMNDQLKYFQ